MKNNGGFISIVVLAGLFGLLVLGGAGYVVLNPQILEKISVQTTPADDGVQAEPGDHAEVEHAANEGAAVDAKTAINWRFESAPEVDGIPQTKVVVNVNGDYHDAGTFEGSCAEVGATGGVDGKGLLAGELSAAQCWYAGGGNEIGIFAHEDGGYEVMVGELSEGDAETAPFRGDFEVKASIQP
jgi:hypothetical protein